MHTTGVNAPSTRKTASTARPANANCEELTCVRGITGMSNMPAADNLNNSKAIPAEPKGNMVNSLCIPPRLLTCSRLNKREKGVREGLLLRGVAVVTREYNLARGSNMSAQHTIRVLTVDDHPLLRGGISGAIMAQPDMTVVAEATDGDEAVACFRIHQPDVTLMDLRMPKANGIEAITAIRREWPNARIIVLTTYGGDVQALRAFKAGASGYLLKSMLRTELIDTIRLVHAGHRRIPQEIALEMAEHVADDALTDRELETLRGVARGKSNKIIAEDLGISEHTVKGHLKSILSKLGASDRTHAVMIAIKRGFLEL